MTKEEIIEKSQAFLSEEFEIDISEIIPESNMHSTLELDSLDYVDLVVIIEENFGVKLTAKNFQEIQSFQQFYDFIYKVKN